MAKVYKITNYVTQKSYIGYTSLTIEERWKQHKTLALKQKTNRKFYNAIRKHGPDAWKIELLLETPTTEEAKKKEIEFIEIHNTYFKGYNSTKGGDGNNGIIMSEESNLKRSKALAGKKKTDSTIAKFKARKATEETCNAIRKSHIGMKKPWVRWDKNQIIKRAMTRRSLTKKQYDDIYQLRSQGFLIKEIAIKVGASCDLVKKWLKRSWEL
jgi:group I intron endonuclease